MFIIRMTVMVLFLVNLGDFLGILIALLVVFGIMKSCCTNVRKVVGSNGSIVYFIL